MANQLTPAGLEINSLQENLENVITSLNGIYGADIDTNQDSPDGQYAGIQAKILTDLSELQVLSKANQNPDTASGTAVDDQLSLLGLDRELSNNSVWDLVVNCSYILTLPTGYTVIDASNNSWSISTSVICNAGDNTITFTAVNAGDIQGSIGEEIKQSTVILGVNTITALVIAVVGRNEELDSNAKIRRKKSTSYPAQGTVSSLYAKILNLADVTDTNITENDTDVNKVVDNFGNIVPPHTLWIVVEGGSTQDIANAIVKGSNTAGVGTKGNIEFLFTENVVYTNSTNTNTYQTSKLIRYDVTAPIPLYIKMNYKKRVATDTINEDLIKQALVSNLYQTGEETIASDLYSVVYSAVSNAIFIDLLISNDDIIFTDSTLQPQFHQKFVIETANISLTDIT